MRSARGQHSRRGVATVVALGLFWSTSAHATDGRPSPKRYISESKEWDAVVEQRRALCRQKAWDQLEVLAESYRHPHARFPSGRWKLSAFYDDLEPEVKEATEPRDWPGLLETLETWRVERPRSVTALTALASAHLGYAWTARGGGYAGSVESAGWRLFQERLGKARRYLEAAEELGSRDPETYVLFLTLARAEGWDGPRRQRMLDKAIAVAPGYHEIYLEEAFDLLPRWHGQPGDVERFAEQAIDRCVDEGEGIYARIVYYLSGFYRADEFFETHPFSWPRARSGFETLQRLYPDSGRNLNAFCFVACFAGDRETAAGLFDRIGEGWVEEVWGSEARYLRWRQWARTPP
jgi:hypothetical protein